MPYIPEVDDYVQWVKDNHTIEGWVYFKSSEYITIEMNVTPKHPEDLPYGTHHRNERTLVVCYPSSWKQLRYIKSRQDKYDEK